MRVVIASMGAEEFALLHGTCVTAGHEPVAYAYSRSMRPGQLAEAYAVGKIVGVVESIPAGVDLLLPADPKGLRAGLAGYRPDLLVLYGFNWVLPPEVFGMPTFGSINIHPSLLPRYRGPAPVHRAILNGDTETGVTVHRVDAGVDTGPILAQRGGVALGEEVTREGLAATMAPLIRDLLTTALARVAAGDPGEPQPEVDVSRAGLLPPELSRVDWSRPAREIHNQVRVFRYTGSESAPVAQVDGRWRRLVRTSLTPVDGVRIECGEGALWIVADAPAEPPVTASS